MIGRGLTKRTLADPSGSFKKTVTMSFLGSGLRMRRRKFIAIAATLTAWPLPISAQQKVWRIGQVAAGRPRQSLTALLERLNDLGYVQGKNITLQPLAVRPEPPAMHVAIRSP